MLSEPLTATAISCGLGAILGLADTAGFYYTVKLFLVNPTTKKRIVSGFLEFFRLLCLVSSIILISFDKNISILWLLIVALPISMSGKIFCILKRFHG
jgi:hypothetical protein